MEPALVVVADVLREGTTERELGRKRNAARQFRFEGVKERFGARVVARPTDAGALVEATTGDEGTEGGAHVLRSAIAVEDQPARRSATRERLREDPAGFPRRATTTERPREHTARVMIQHNREIAPAIGEGEIGDVADPHLIGPRDVGLPHAIRVLGEARATPGLGAIAAHGFRAEAGRPHETSDATAAYVPSGTPQLAINPRTAVACIVLSEQLNDRGR